MFFTLPYQAKIITNLHLSRILYSSPNGICARVNVYEVVYIQMALLVVRINL